MGGSFLNFIISLELLLISGTDKAAVPGIPHDV